MLSARMGKASALVIIDWVIVFDILLKAYSVYGIFLPSFHMAYFLAYFLEVLVISCILLELHFWKLLQQGKLFPLSAFFRSRKISVLHIPYGEFPFDEKLVFLQHLLVFLAIVWSIQQFRIFVRAEENSENNNNNYNARIFITLIYL